MNFEEKNRQTEQETAPVINVSGLLTPKNMKQLLLLVFLVILMGVAMTNLDVIGGWIATAWDILFPFILGACIAFMLNVLVVGLEKRIIKKQFKGKRGICVLLSLLFIIAVIVLVLFLVIPQLVNSGKSIAEDVKNLGSVDSIIDRIVDRFPVLAPYVERFNLSYAGIMQQLSDWLVNYADDIMSSAAGVLSSAAGVVSSFASGLATFLIGLVFSIYVLMKKETLCRQARQILFAFFKPATADRILSVANLTNETFSNFVRGQCLEAFILGSIFFICMTIFGFPYALLCSVLIMVTALIPYFGAFIGCAVSVLLILMVSPKQALFFLIMFLVIQQIEGKLIYPRVVGGSVGLPSIWVLFSITVGGNIMGIAGMIIFVPLCSVLYALFRELVLARLQEKKVDPEFYNKPYIERVPTDIYAEDLKKSDPDNRVKKASAVSLIKGLYSKKATSVTTATEEKIAAKQAAKEEEEKEETKE